MPERGENPLKNFKTVNEICKIESPLVIQYSRNIKTPFYFMRLSFSRKKEELHKLIVNYYYAMAVITDLANFIRLLSDLAKLYVKVY
jgi:hypothetical protein